MNRKVYKALKTRYNMITERITEKKVTLNCHKTLNQKNEVKNERN